MNARSTVIVLVAFTLAFVGCWLTDDLFTQVAMVAGAAGVAVVLADLARYPHRPKQPLGEPSQKLSP